MELSGKYNGDKKLAYKISREGKSHGGCVRNMGRICGNLTGND
jgi:hypothetical protein